MQTQKLKISPIYSGGMEEFRRVFAIFETNKQEYSQKTREKYQKILDRWREKIKEKDEKERFSAEKKRLKNHTPRLPTFMSDTHKQCYTCREILTKDNFYACVQGKGGLSASCKNCLRLSK